MKHWTLIRSISELKTFQIEFSELDQDEQDAIIAEMLIHIQEYQDSVTINGEEQKLLELPRQVEIRALWDKANAGAKRRGRRPRIFNG